MTKSTVTILKSKAYDILLYLYEEKYPISFTELFNHLQPINRSIFRYYLANLKNKSLIIQEDTRYTTKKGYLISPSGRTILDKIKMTLRLIPSLDEITENKKEIQT